MKRYRVSAASAGQRADLFLAKTTGYSRSSLERLFDLGKVELNSSALKASQKLKAGDVLVVDDKLLHADSAELALPVIYEDDDVIVLNKPAGILTHSKGALNLESTVADSVKNKLTDREMTGNRAGIVHRLDRHTSGVIIVAKNSKALKWLQKQFSTRKVMKEYVAIVHRLPKEDQAKIDVPIARNPKRPNTFKVIQNGKPAQTMYKVLKTFKRGGETYSSVGLWPYTGRTHQLRVHMAYIGHPIAGDGVYGHDDGRVMLHAKQLELVLPSGNKHKFSAPVPDYFKSFEAIK